MGRLGELECVRESAGEVGACRKRKKKITSEMNIEILLSLLLNSKL